MAAQVKGGDKLTVEKKLYWLRDLHECLVQFLTEDNSISMVEGGCGRAMAHQLEQLGGGSSIVNTIIEQRFPWVADGMQLE